MKQQEQKNITNPMSGRRKKSSRSTSTSSSGIIGVPLCVGIPVIILMLAAFGYFYDIEYTVKKDPHAFVGNIHAPNIDTTTSRTRLKDTTTITADHQQQFAASDPEVVNTDDEAVDEEALVVVTKYGNIRIVLRPDLSPESVEYVKKIAANGCDNCKFHRSEKDLLVQGVMRNNNNKVPLNTVFGKCPEPNYKPKNHNKCPDHDPDCGCHGPVMTRGMVGWAGGTSGGPDWFINIFKKPVEWWENQHTVWGELRDAESFQTIQNIQELPVTKRGVMWTLDVKIPFTTQLE
mmetsp:Transcript_25655/g.38734  ORF Transcript_25655/g.38734 Transcript_25655/m.38734 type:complete len:290 (-) Transcript_25655:34-903(-)